MANPFMKILVRVYDKEGKEIATLEELEDPPEQTVVRVVELDIPTLLVIYPEAVRVLLDVAVTDSENCYAD